MRSRLWIFGLCTISLLIGGGWWLMSGPAQRAQPTTIDPLAAADDDDIEVSNAVSDSGVPAAADEGGSGATRTDVATPSAAAPAPKWRLRLRALIVDAGGAPVSNQALRFQAPQRVAWRPAKTSASGRVELGLNRVNKSNVLAVEVPSAGSGVRGARVAFKLAEAEDGVLDLGVIKLSAWQLLAQGQVIDDRGRPVAGAQVRMSPPGSQWMSLRSGPSGVSSTRFSRPRASSGTLQELSVPRTIQLGAVPAAPSRVSLAELRLAEADIERTLNLLSHSSQISLGELQQVVDVRSGLFDNSARKPKNRGIGSATTDADGRFEIWGEGCDLPALINARAADHTSTRSTVDVLGASVELRLQRTADVTGSVLVPQWLPGDALTLRLLGSNGKPRSKRARTEATDGRVEFAFEGEVPGSYTLVVQLRGLPQPAARFEQVMMLAGETTVDPRLQNIDLRGAVHRFELRAVDAHVGTMKELPSPLLVKIRGADNNVSVRGFSWEDGAIELFSADEELDVTLLCRGYRREEQRIRAGRSDLIYTPINPVEIVLPGLRSLCGPKRRIRVSMIKEGGTGLPQGLRGLNQRSGKSKSYSRWHLGKSGGAWMEPYSDLVQVPLVLNGTYEVVIRLHEEGVSGNRSIELQKVEVVLDGTAPVRHVLNFDSEAVTRVLAGLERERLAREERKRQEAESQK